MMLSSRAALAASGFVARILFCLQSLNVLAEGGFNQRAHDFEEAAVPALHGIISRGSPAAIKGWAEIVEASELPCRPAVDVL